MFDLAALIKSVGYLGVFGIVFAESGLFIGFFLPGDSLLFTAGILASRGYFNLWALITFCFLGAVLGDSFGYGFGRRMGPKIFTKEESLFFQKKRLQEARVFYEKYGAKTIVLARFTPFIRTFAPILAGVGEMRYTKFLFYNVLGGLLWSVSLPILGYFFGNLIPNIDYYILPIIGLIVIASVAPIIIEIYKNKNK